MAEANVYCVVLSRRDDCSREEFLDAWLREHRQLIEQLPLLAEVRLLPVAEPNEGGPDGVGLLFFRSAADLAEALGSEAARRLRDHTVTFAKSDEAVRLLLVEE